MESSKKRKVKIVGRVYTPNYIVKNILDLAGYEGTKILKKHVMDNSCGDGAFLIEIVKCYCEAAITKKMQVDEIKIDLETYIHGIELDDNECNKAKERISNVALKYGIQNVTWDVISKDALEVTKYDGMMDYVLGNPPYVRVHNLGNTFQSVKNFSFAQNGMTDLFIVFFEIGLLMLNDNGVLGYITPNSYFNSLAGKYMRKYFIAKKILAKIVDLKHYQAFKATTYNAITILNKNSQNDIVEYYEYDEKYKEPIFVDRLNYEDFFIMGSYYFGKRRELKNLLKILSYNADEENFRVKNGYATLNDSLFIGKFNFKKFVIPIVKASTGETKQCVYPYTKDGKLVPFNELPNEVKEYFNNYRETLNDRSLQNNESWYGFGRTQGLLDTYKKKYAINTMIRTKTDIKIIACNSGVGVYSGLYILTNVEIGKIQSLLISDKFVSYVRMLAKYKNNGYYTYSSHDIQQYLEYMYKLEGEKQ